MRWALTILLILIPAVSGADTFTVCSSGCDYTEVENVLDGEDLSAGGHTIELRESIAEPDRITWASGDSGVVGSYNTLDLNGHTLSIAAGEYAIFSLNDADYITVENGAMLGTSDITQTIHIIGGAQYIVVSDVTIDTNGGDRGVVLEDSASSITIDACTISGRTLQGILVRDDIDNATIQNCLIIGSDRAVYVYDADGVDFPTDIKAYNNTFYGYDDYGIQIFSNVAASGVTIQNNIFYGDGSCEGIDSDDAGSAPTHDYNSFYNNTLDFSNAAGANDIGANSLTTDPRLTGDYWPQNPALWSGGTDLTGTFTDDYYGISRDTTPTIGAVEVGLMRLNLRRGDD